MSEYATIHTNARTKYELDVATEAVAEVFGAAVRLGERYELASGEPPYDLIINLITMTATLYAALGGPPVMQTLFTRLKQRITDRRIQVQCTWREEGDKTVLYHCYEDTPNDALRSIVLDVQRERAVKDPTPMRWWAAGEWKTIGEYQEWLKRK